MNDAPKTIPEVERLRRLKFQAWHRGTREADYVIGGFFDAHHALWSADDLLWFEALLAEEDVDILGWAFAALEVPVRYQGELMLALQRLDYVTIPR